MIDGLIRDGKVVADTRIDLVRSGIGVEVRAGATKPDISSVDAFKRALLNAKSIGYLKVGSGAYLAPLLERLGIADAIASKVTRPDTDVVSELVAKGEVELGMVVITQIMTTPGVELVGPLPPEIQSYVTFTGGVGANAKAPDAAKALLEFLQRPVAAPSGTWVKKSPWMNRPLPAMLASAKILCASFVGPERSKITACRCA